MTRRLLPGLGLLATAACGRLDSIPCSPPQTPESWLAGQPFVELTLAPRSVVLVQPSSTALIYLLGLLGVALGVRGLLRRDQQRVLHAGLIPWMLCMGAFVAPRLSDQAEG